MSLINVALSHNHNALCTLGLRTAQISFRSDAIEGVFELEFMHVNRDIGVAEEVETTSVVEVEVSNDDHFDVFDFVAGLGDLRVEGHG
jgi:hypothetical protein